MKDRMMAARATRGFTLVEMMIAVLILGVVSIGLYRMLNSSRDSYEQQKVTLEMQQNARVALEALAEDFRHVSYGKDPTQPSIEYAGPDSVTFIADIMPLVSGAEVISYALSPLGDPDTPNPNDTILMKTVCDSGGVVLFREAQSYGIKYGGLSFRYFNGQGFELENPVPQPELIGEALLEVTAIEPRAHKRTGNYMELTLSTTVYPRNLPLTPARSRPSTPVVGPLSVPDCESITVPWQTPTTNTDGTPLPLSDISHFTVYFGTDPGAMSLYCRVARTINEWTIPSLEGGIHYYFGVTCTSRSGVESYMGLDDHDLTSPLIPLAPTGLTYQANPGGSGIRLDWNAVTEFQGGSSITTPIQYVVYRDTYPGLSPDPAYLLGTVSVNTWYVDSTMTECQDYYYVVTAEACGNEGSASGELYAVTPAPPSSVTDITPALTEISGEVLVQWAPPSTRIDGAPLPPDEVAATRIYYGTTPHVYPDSIELVGAPTSYVLTTLETCTRYYLNVACLDECGHLGDIIPGNEANIQTSSPCDPAPPETPGTLAGLGVDDRIQLCWPINEIDCDLYGYRVYYGTQPGGPYNGTGAAEGPSPITFPLTAVQEQDSCRVSLTGFENCQTYAVVVTCLDICDPPNESGYSPEEVVDTDCLPCAFDAGCANFLCTGSNLGDVRAEIYPSDGITHTLTRLIPSWSGQAKVEQIWSGRPLVKVWDADGSAGEDGPVGTQSSGAQLDVDDFDVPWTASQHDGMPLMLCFNQGQQMQTVELCFRGQGGSCYAAPRQVSEALAYDDFDDGNNDGWSEHSGTWFVNAGELYQSDGAGTALTTLPVNFSDYVFECKQKNTYGTTPYVVFRYEDSSNYYMLGFKISQNIVRFCEYRYGSFSVTAEASYPCSNDEWYALRIEVAGTTATAYVNCEEVLQVSDASMRPSGRIGFRTYYSKCYFDDVRIGGPEALP